LASRQRLRQECQRPRRPCHYTLTLPFARLAPQTHCQTVLASDLDHLCCPGRRICPRPGFFWDQISVVFLIVLVTTWAATQWTPWRLGFQPELGQPLFELARGVPVCLPPAFFWVVVRL
jgi:hypothetical protein